MCIYTNENIFIRKEVHRQKLHNRKSVDNAETIVYLELGSTRRTQVLLSTLRTKYMQFFEYLLFSMSSMTSGLCYTQLLPI